MRDMSGIQFNSNSPARNYLKLNQRIEELNRRLRETEQMAIEAIARVNEISNR